MRGGLEVGASLDQHAVARRGGEPGDHADRGRDDQRAGAGDDENHQPLVDPAFPPPAGQQRWEHRYREGEEHHRRGVDPGETVHPLLAGRAVRPALLDQVDHPRQGGVAGGMGHPDLEDAFAVDRPGVHFAALLHVHGEGFTGDRRLVHRGPAPGHHAVQRDFLPGPDDHPHPRHGGLRRDHFGAALLAEDPRHRRRERHQGLDRPAGAGHAPGFEKQREGEEEGDRRGLQPGAKEDRTDDRHGHQQVHVRPEPPGGEQGLREDVPAARDHRGEIDQGDGQGCRPLACQGGAESFEQAMEQETEQQQAAGGEDEDEPTLAPPEALLDRADSRCAELFPGLRRHPGRGDRPADGFVQLALYRNGDLHPAAEHVEPQVLPASDERSDLASEHRHLIGAVHAMDLVTGAAHRRLSVLLIPLVRSSFSKKNVYTIRAATPRGSLEGGRPGPEWSGPGFIRVSVMNVTCCKNLEAHSRSHHETAFPGSGMKPKAAHSGTPGATRTRDLRIRNPLLYPAELRGRLQREYSLPTLSAVHGRAARKGCPEARRNGANGSLGSGPARRSGTQAAPAFETRD